MTASSESQRKKAEIIELLAARVVDMLEPRLRDLIRAELECRDAQPVKLGDATQLARALGVSRATVYEHADELGAIRVGDGKRPRLRFDLGEAVETWRAHGDHGCPAITCDAGRSINRRKRWLHRWRPMTTAAPEREYLTIAEVALRLGISVPTVRRKIAAGELPAVQLGGPGTAIRIPHARLEAWLRSEA